MFISFNGGKDCTVLLDMINSYVKTERILNSNEIRCIYIRPEQAFDEMDQFVDDCETYYDLKIERISDNNIKAGLENICTRYPSLKVCFMGNRRTDPYCKDLQFMQNTDNGWPALVRINPLLDWNCNQIWQYLQRNDVPFCSLYELGYTSIGHKNNTIPNPHLKQEDETFLPAYKLIDADHLERAGRY